MKTEKQIFDKLVELSREYLTIGDRMKSGANFEIDKFLMADIGLSADCYTDFLEDVEAEFDVRRPTRNKVSGSAGLFNLEVQLTVPDLTYRDFVEIVIAGDWPAEFLK